MTLQFCILFEPSFLHLRDQPITVKWQSVITGTENFLPFYWEMVQKIGFNLNWKNNTAIQSFYKLINFKRGCTLCRCDKRDAHVRLHEWYEGSFRSRIEGNVNQDTKLTYVFSGNYILSQMLHCSSSIYQL